MTLPTPPGDDAKSDVPPPLVKGLKPPGFDKRLVNGIAVLVAAVWAVSFIADIVLTDYEPSPFIHLAMMTVVGAVVGRGFIKGSD